MLPKIEVVTIWYNEAFLAPFFLNHYAFADHIRIFYDVDSTDNTKEIIGRYPNVRVEDLKYPDGYDDIIRAETLTDAYRESKADWVIAADADEFVFLEDGFLEKQTDDIVFVRLFQVYRNINDMDLDPSKPIKEQRRCGEPDVVKGQNSNGMKPIIVRTGKGIHWMPGCHKIWNRHKFTTSPDILLGTHWVMADPCFCIDRRITRPIRQSQRNKDLGNSSHYNNIIIK
jgi:hypothetical protein